MKCKIDLKNYEFFVMLWNVSTYILRVTKRRYYYKEERGKKAKGKITVKATKIEKPTISLNGEKEEDLNTTIYGTFLDVKK